MIKLGIGYKGYSAIWCYTNVLGVAISRRLAVRVPVKIVTKPIALKTNP